MRSGFPSIVIAFLPPWACLVDLNKQIILAYLAKNHYLYLKY